MSDRAKITCAKLLRESTAAVQIEHKGVVAWIPKSQIDYQRKQGTDITLEIPEWLAEAKGLDYE